MKANSTEAELILKHDAYLGEGPVWDEGEEKLYWVDILSGRLLIFDPFQKSNSAFNIGEALGAVALRKRGGLVLAIQTGFALFDLETQEITKIGEPEVELTGRRFNDGKCDPSGRFWAGTLSYDLEEGTGSLYCLNSGLQTELKMQGLTIPNGMAWNHDKNRFFFIDSPTGKVFSFDYEDRSGTISNKRVLREFAANEGSPDGMTIDEEDGLWVALYGGNKVVRIDPDQGVTRYEVRLPAPRVTSCTFGGAELNELYITTAQEHMSEQEIAQAPLSGSLFKASVPWKGIPASRFSG